MIKLLFICTHNRCRSILAEAITNHYGKALLVARSAGSQPAGKVHPLSIDYLSEAGISTDNLCSQSWDEYESWEPDIVITVCDSAAKESCPVWFGTAIKVHWGLSDPSTLTGTHEDIANGFRDVITILKNRIEKLVTTDLKIQNKDEVIRVLEQLGNN